MITAKELISQIQDISEERGRVVPGKRRVVGGKKVKDTRKTYKKSCRPGYKRDSAGKCVKMEQTEKRNRSKSAIKAGKKSSSKVKRARSNKKRKQLNV